MHLNWPTHTGMCHEMMFSHVEMQVNNLYLVRKKKKEILIKILLLELEDALLINTSELFQHYKKLLYSSCLH